MSRTQQLPAFTPGSFYEDCELLFPVSPRRPTRQERMDQARRLAVLERVRWWRVRVVCG
jgi:hypothetical protein